MKTYKQLYEQMLNPETITKCALDAAKGKIRRPNVYKPLININQTKKKVIACLSNPNYRPSTGRLQGIIVK